MALDEALTVLNERERRIFEGRRLAEEPITLEELADEFGVSRERVRQIEMRAFEKVQKAARLRVAAMERPELEHESASISSVNSYLPQRRHRVEGARPAFI
jgi:RNA polymerase sigma-32 factor